LVCYQRVPRRSWIVFLGLALAGAEAFHYYAFFSFVPFAIAELAWTAQAKKIRWGVWLAFAAGFLPLLASWPLLMELKRFYGAGFWGKPSFAVIEHAYDGFFSTAMLRVVPGLGFIFAAALSVAAILTGLFSEPPNRATEKSHTFHEALLAVGLLGVPFVAFAATAIGHGSLSGRYLLSMVLGVAIATSYVLRLLRGRGLVFLALIAFLLVGIGRQEMPFWKGEHRHLASFSSPADSVGVLLKLAGQPDLPVVVSDGETYVELAYYAPPELAKRLVGIVDPPNAIAYAGSDSVDRQMLALTCCLTLQVYEFRGFATEHPSFLLYSDGSAFDWWPARLRKDGYLLEPVASDGDRNVYWANRNRDLH
jgi:hypothetical protein